MKTTRLFLLTRTVLTLTALACGLSYSVLYADDAPNTTVAEEKKEDAEKTDATATKEVKAQDLTLAIPESWEEQQASNNLRLAQYGVPAVEGDEDPTEYVVFPPFGGTIQQNIDRWVAQFTPEGRDVKMLDGEATQGKYVLVDLTGTYKKPDGPPFLRKTIDAPDYKMVAVIITVNNGGNYFLKITGPIKSVEAAINDFRKSFGGDAEKEKPREI